MISMRYECCKDCGTSYGLGGAEDVVCCSCSIPPAYRPAAYFSNPICCRPLFQKLNYPSPPDAYLEIDRYGNVVVDFNRGETPLATSFRFPVRNNLLASEIEELISNVSEPAKRLVCGLEYEEGVRIMSPESTEAFFEISGFCSKAVTSHLNPCENKGCEFCHA